MEVVAAQPEPDTSALTLDSLTAAETALAERKAGQSITTLGSDRFPQSALIGALGWVLYRRTDVRITYDAYMESRTLQEITRELGLSDDDEAQDEEQAEGKDDAPISPS